MYLEPSAGSGNFLNYLSNYVALDIKPEDERIMEQDFLIYQSEKKDYITIGNPPFGSRSGLAIEFFNKASLISDVIASAAIIMESEIERNICTFTLSIVVDTVRRQDSVTQIGIDFFAVEAAADFEVTVRKTQSVTSCTVDFLEQSRQSRFGAGDESDRFFVLGVTDDLTLFQSWNRNVDIVIVDFFAGSGTTLHATNLLNAEDGGKRRCIMITNNEISEAEKNEFEARGIKQGDEEWENKGIARYVTWPRTVCSILGKDVNGNPLDGDYGVIKTK